MREHGFMLAFITLATCAAGPSANAKPPSPTIVVSARANALTSFAAKEVRHYLYLLTGELPPIRQHIGKKDAIVIAVNGDPGTEFLGEGLGPQAYRLKTVTRDDGHKTLYLVGGSESATLYAAYRFAEHLGARFYLHGDVLPDTQTPFAMPDLDETRTPLFELRGIQPFHDFAEGPDWWNRDEYKTVIAQLPKLGMNFIGLHTYPLSEPTVWTGLAEDVEPDGRVRESYPTAYLNTARTVNWGYEARPTSEYACGASIFYDRDDYSGDVMRDLTPLPDTPEKCNELFNRTGALLNDAFSFARQLGVKTCVGTETPVSIPPNVGKRLGNTPNAAMKVYEGIFSRIMRAYPIDYYWLWTPEAWTWEGTTHEQVDQTLRDIEYARQALGNISAPFSLATCGWVLGPQYDRALLGKALSADISLSCISRAVGFDPVEPGFAEVSGRGKWAIPWLEDDPAMCSPQLWAGRMRRDAHDALRYGCTGLMGIHWRTRVIAPNVAALAQAAWQQGSDWGMPSQGSVAMAGNSVQFPGADIEGTEDPEIYRYHRWGMTAYRLQVPNGVYRVTLKMAEPGFTEPGKRIFEVSVAGKKVIENLDLFQKVGRNKAIDFTFENVQVSDGYLVIDFLPVVEFPIVAGIVVQGEGIELKINCGGAAHGDYQADLPAFHGHVPTEDFYTDWARHEFGPAVADDAGRILASVDGKLPRPSEWAKGPGGFLPDLRPWNAVSKEFTFVDAFAALRPRVQGAGNTERFLYWLNTLEYLRASARMRCVWGEYSNALVTVNSMTDASERTAKAREILLPARKALIASVEEAYRYLMDTVSTTGEMGNITNIEAHTFPSMLDAPGKELEELLGAPLPADAQISREYTNAARLIVTAPRSVIENGESLSARVVVASKAAPESVTLRWRPLGKRAFRSLPLTCSGRGTYEGMLPAHAMKGKDIEYHIEARFGEGEPTLVWPVTAPKQHYVVTQFDVLRHPANSPAT